VGSIYSARLALFFITGVGEASAIPSAAPLQHLTIAAAAVELVGAHGEEPEGALICALGPGAADGEPIIADRPGEEQGVHAGQSHASGEVSAVYGGAHAEDDAHPAKGVSDGIPGPRPMELRGGRGGLGDHGQGVSGAGDGGIVGPQPAFAGAIGVLDDPIDAIRRFAGHLGAFAHQQRADDIVLLPRPAPAVGVDAHRDRRPIRGGRKGDGWGRGQGGLRRLAGGGRGFRRGLGVIGFLRGLGWIALRGQGGLGQGDLGLGNPQGDLLFGAPGRELAGGQDQGNGQQGGEDFD